MIIYVSVCVLHSGFDFRKQKSLKEETKLTKRIVHVKTLQQYALRFEVYLGNLLHIYHVFGILGVWTNYLGAPSHLVKKRSHYTKNRKCKLLTKPPRLNPYLKGLLLLHHLLVRNKIPLARCS